VPWKDSAYALAALGYALTSTSRRTSSLVLGTSNWKRRRSAW
jgi:hypothetical protein